MNPIMHQPICYHFNEMVISPLDTCPTADAIFAKWGVSKLDDNNCFVHITRKVADFFFSIGIQLSYAKTLFNRVFSSKETQQPIWLEPAERVDSYFLDLLSNLRKKENWNVNQPISTFFRKVFHFIDVTITTWQSATPLLHRSLKSDDVQEIIRLALVNKEDTHSYFDPITKKGSSLTFALTNERFNAFTLLAQDLGADLNRPLYEWQIHLPIYFAASMKNPIPLWILVQAGANLTAASQLDGNQAIHYAASSGNVEALIALTQGGADPCAKNNEGHTAHEMALYNKHEETFNFLQTTCPMPEF